MQCARALTLAIAAAGFSIAHAPAAPAARAAGAVSAAKQKKCKKTQRVVDAGLRRRRRDRPTVGVSGDAGERQRPH